MIYPKFESHILITTDREELVLYTEKLLIEKMQEEHDDYITISTKHIKPEENTSSDKEWIYNSSMFDVFVGDDFINDHFIKQTDEYKSFLEHFEEFLKPFQDISKYYRKKFLD